MTVTCQGGNLTWESAFFPANLSNPNHSRSLCPRAGGCRRAFRWALTHSTTSYCAGRALHSEPVCVCVCLAAELPLLPVPLLVLGHKLGPYLPLLTSWPEASGFHPEVYPLLPMNQHLFFTVCIPPFNYSMEMHPPKLSFPLLELVTLSDKLVPSGQSHQPESPHQPYHPRRGRRRIPEQMPGERVPPVCAVPASAAIKRR